MKVSMNEATSNIVFDQFQRYKLLGKIIDLLTNGKLSNILEVGAAFSPLRQLLPGYPIINLDVVTADHITVRGSGLHLPFPDQSFEIVASIDVLEHLPERERAPFIQQLQRVSRNAVILAFPMKTALTNQADQTFSQAIQKLTGNTSSYVAEHIEHQLPDRQEIFDSLKTFFPEIYEYQNANVHSWLLLQLSNFLMLQFSEIDVARGLFNQIFNEYFESLSHESPAYRVFFVCLKSPPSSEMRQQLEKLRMPDLAQQADSFVVKALALTTAIWDAIEEKDRKIASLDQQNNHLLIKLKGLQDRLREEQKTSSDYRQSVLALQDRNQNLQEYLDLFLKHPAYRIYKLGKRILYGSSKSLKTPLFNDIEYEIFQKSFEPDNEELNRQSQEWLQWHNPPVLNLVTAVYSPPLSIFQETVRSVLNQTYGNWFWNIVDASETDAIWTYLKEESKNDNRIRIHRLNGNQGISGNTNVALEQASGEFIVMLDHDDTLAKHALYEVANVIHKNPEIDFLYSDADKLDVRGQRCQPLFKPDWSPEMMLCCNLMNQLSVFRRTLLNEVGYLKEEMDGAQDWDLYLRIIEKTSKVFHIPQVLYHWRMTPHSTAVNVNNKPYAKKSQIAAITNHLRRRGLQNPAVKFDPTHNVFQNHPLSTWTSKQKKVSIIVPSKDQLYFIKRCLESLMNLTEYRDYEIVIVDTGSLNKETWIYYEILLKSHRVRVIKLETPFNFSKACNLGARNVNGDFLLFLNNDTEVIHSDWLSSMVQWFEIPEIAIVGPKLIYPDGKVQHAGVIVGLGGMAANLFRQSKDSISTLFGSDSWYRNLSAVTGACLLIRRDIFEKVNGFDEMFQFNYSDVDLCLRVREAGYRVLFTPHARMIHHEGVTTQKVTPKDDFLLANTKWLRYLTSGDPYYNPNLSYRDRVPTFKKSELDLCSSANELLVNALPDKQHIILTEDAPL
ncbi:glycosyltransferase [bacterium]|nr:glycosyltransferase [bacterium]